MKIWCDMCNREEASVFCSADEAAVCQVCDRNVHHANKLVSKHSRFSLLHPTFKESPLCDICQERRALLFCQEDRTILCRECDIPIHKANEHTTKHSRFLLTGVNLSSSSSSSSFSALNPASSSSNNGDQTIGSNVKSTSQSGNDIFSSEHNYAVDDKVPISTSSISEYLMETLPGWRVDDFLQPKSAYI